MRLLGIILFSRKGNIILLFSRRLLLRLANQKIARVQLKPVILKTGEVFNRYIVKKQNPKFNKTSGILYRYGIQLIHVLSMGGLNGQFFCFSRFAIANYLSIDVK